MLTANGETFGFAAAHGRAQGVCMGFRKQPIGRLHFKVAKGEIVTANTQFSMAYCAVITEHPKSSLPHPLFIFSVLFTSQLHFRLSGCLLLSVYYVIVLSSG